MPGCFTCLVVTTSNQVGVLTGRGGTRKERPGSELGNVEVRELVLSNGKPAANADMQDLVYRRHASFCGCPALSLQVAISARDIVYAWVFLHHEFCPAGGVKK